MASLVLDPQFSILHAAILVLWVVAFLNTILSLALVPRLFASGTSPVRVSALIPARNEARRIGATVRALLAQTHPFLEVIVVNDRSTDETAEILSSFDDPRLRVVEGEEPPAGWLGKPWALHQASQRARGELLLFLDADIHYEPDAVAAAVAYLEESGVAMISLLPRIEMRGFWENVLMPNLAFMVFTAMPLWLANRTRARRLAAGGGPGNLVRRAAYDAAGGHEALKDSVVDDVALARLLRRSGQRTQMVRADDLVSVRMYHGLRETIEGFTKNTFTVFGRSYAAMLFVLAASVALHLLPYVFALRGVPTAIATVGVLTLTRVILFSSLGYRLDNALFGHPLMVLVWDVIFVRSTWVTGIRRQLHWRGRRYDAGRTRFGAD